MNENENYCHLENENENEIEILTPKTNENENYFNEKREISVLIFIQNLPKIDHSDPEALQVSLIENGSGVTDVLWSGSDSTGTAGPVSSRGSTSVSRQCLS